MRVGARKRVGDLIIEFFIKPVIVDGDRVHFPELFPGRIFPCAECVAAVQAPEHQRLADMGDPHQRGGQGINPSVMGQAPVLMRLHEADVIRNNVK